MGFAFLLALHAAPIPALMGACVVLYTYNWFTALYDMPMEIQFPAEVRPDSVRRWCGHVVSKKNRDPSETGRGEDPVGLRLGAHRSPATREGRVVMVMPGVDPIDHRARKLDPGATPVNPCPPS